MTDENKIRLELEAKASTSTTQSIDQLADTVKRATNMVQGLENALKQMWGRAEGSLAQMGQFQRRARQLGVGDPSTVLVNTAQQRRRNVRRADPANQLYEEERDLQKLEQRRMALFNRYAERWERFVAAHRGFTDLTNQFSRNPAQERELQRFTAALRSAERDLVSAMPRGRHRQNFEGTLQDFIHRGTHIRDTESANTLARLLNNQGFTNGFDSAKRELPQLMAMRVAAAKAQREEAAATEAAARAQEHLNTARKVGRNQSYLDRTVNNRLYKQFNRHGLPDLIGLQDEEERARTFQSQMRVMRERALAAGANFDETRFRDRYADWDARRTQGEQLRAQREAARQTPEHYNRLGEQATIAAAARRNAFGGAGLFTTQADLLRNYAVMGAGIGSVGFLGNFAVTFEEELANLQAIAAATRGEMQQLQETFESAAQASKFSAQEIVQASVLMAQAGLSARDIDESLQSVINLATGTGTDLATTVDVVTSTISVFNLQTSEAADVANTLTEAMNRSKLGISQFQLGLQYAGNIAAEQGLSYQELTAAMAGMADQGIRAGSTLGTGLRQMLIDLQTPTDKARAHFMSLGLSMSQLDVRTHGLFGVLRNLQRAGFTTADALQTFEVRAASAFTALVADLPAVENMRDTMSGTEAATDAAGVQMDTLAARFTQFANAAGIATTTGLEPLIEGLKGFLQIMSAVLKFLNDIGPVLQAAFTGAFLVGMIQAGNYLQNLVNGFAAQRQAMLGQNGAIDAQSRKYGILTGAVNAYTRSLKTASDAFKAGMGDAVISRTTMEDRIGGGGQTYGPIARRDTQLEAELGSLARRNQEINDERMYVVDRQRSTLLAQREAAATGVYQRYRDQYGTSLTEQQRARYRMDVSNATAPFQEGIVAQEARRGELLREQALLVQRQRQLETELNEVRSRGTEALNDQARAANFANEAHATGAIAITTLTARSQAARVAMGALNVAMVATANAAKSFGAAIVSAPISTFMFAVGAVVTVMGVWDALFESNKEKADKLATTVANLQGEMDSTAQEMNAVSDALKRVDERAIGLSDSSVSLADRQQALRDIVAENVDRFGNLTDAMGDQITTISELRESLLRYQQTLNESFLLEARLTEQSLQRQEAQAEGDVQRRFNSYRANLTGGLREGGRPLTGLSGRILGSIERDDPDFARRLREVSSGAEPFQGARLDAFSQVVAEVSRRSTQVSGQLQDDSLAGAERRRLEQLSDSYQRLLDEMRPVIELARPLVSARRQRIQNQPALTRAEIMDQSSYSNLAQRASEAQTAWDSQILALTEQYPDPADLQRQIAQLRETGSFLGANGTETFKEFLENAQEAAQAIQFQVVEGLVGVEGRNLAQARADARSAFESTDLGRDLLTLQRVRDRDPFSGRPQTREQIGETATLRDRAWSREEQELLRRAQGRNRGTLSGLQSEGAALSQRRLDNALAAFDIENSVSESLLADPDFLNTALGLRRSDLEAQHSASARQLQESLEQYFGRADRGRDSGIEAIQQELQNTYQNLGQLNDPDQVNAAKDQFTQLFEEFRTRRLADAGSNSAEVERELNAMFKEGMRRFDDAFIDILIKHVDKNLDSAQRAYDRVASDAKFEEDILDGLQNRGRAGDSRRAVQQYRTEQELAGALPGRIHSQQTAIDRLTAERANQQALIEGLSGTELAAAEARIRELDLQIQVREQELYSLSQQNRLNTEERATPTITNEDPNYDSVLGEDFTNQVNDALTVWAQASGVMKDTADSVVDAIVGSFSALRDGIDEGIKGIVLGTMSVEDAIRNMTIRVLESMLDFAVEMLTNQIIRQAIELFSGFITPGAGAKAGGSGGGGLSKLFSGKAQGGRVTGGTPGRDSVPTMLMPDEFVVRKSAADMIGHDALALMNATGRVAANGASNIVPMAMKREPDLTNVWVVTPDQVPPFSSRDVIVTLQKDFGSNGPVRKMVKQVAMGG